MDIAVLPTTVFAQYLFTVQQCGDSEPAEAIGLLPREEGGGLQPASLMMFWFMALRARHYDYLSLLQLIKLCPEHVVCGPAVADSVGLHGDGGQGNGHICIVKY